MRLDKLKTAQYAIAEFFDENMHLLNLDKDSLMRLVKARNTIQDFVESKERNA